jgi:hypothetical protein
MREKTDQKQQGIFALTILAVMAWVAFSFAGFGTAEANNLPADCPNGPLRATLTGADISGKTPSGTAQYKDKNNNSLMVMVRSVNVAADTTLSVMIGGTSVGQIKVPKSGNGQLKVDSATGISEGTTITVMNGETTVLSGTFACVAGGGGSTTPSPTTTPTASPTVSPTVSPTASPTVTPTVSPTMSPTATPTPTIRN